VEQLITRRRAGLIMTPTQHAALQLLALGFSVVPTNCQKKPLIKWQRLQQERLTQREVLLSKPPGIAIVTGEISGCVVVDCDSTDAWHRWNKRGQWPGMVVKTRRGWHCYYRHPGQRIMNVGTGFIDVRGDGGYVVAPPTLGQYRIMEGSYGQRNAWPVFDANWFPQSIPQPLPPPKEFVCHDLDRYVAAAIEDECRQLAAMMPGNNRNKRLYVAAFKLGKYVGRGDVSEQLVESLLCEAAESCGLRRDYGLGSIQRTIRSGFQSLGKCTK
jgi:hypothetical protein